MKVKQLLAQINKALKDGTLNQDSIVVLNLPTSYYHDRGILMPSSMFSVGAKVTTMTPVDEDESIPSELCFEPHINQYRKVMAEDFGKTIPITA